MLQSQRYRFYRLQASSGRCIQHNVVGCAGVLSKSVYVTPTKACHCGHRSMSKGHDISATVYTLSGPVETTVRTMRCNGYNCRATFGPNFVAEGGHKRNTATQATMSDVLFINNKKGFSIKHLEYHAALEFRAFLSYRAVEDAYNSVFVANGEHEFDEEYKFHKMHGNALMYWLALRELEPLGLHHQIFIGDELCSETVAAYDNHLHSQVFPPRKAGGVTELVGDGHSKVHLKCGSSSAHAGRPRKDGKCKPFGHGWFMLVNPRDLRIVSVESMVKPENNLVVERSLVKALPHYPKVNGFILDRACSFTPSPSSTSICKQVKYWSVDKFHAQGHKKTCKLLASRCLLGAGTTPGFSKRLAPFGITSRSCSTPRCTTRRSIARRLPT